MLIFANHGLIIYSVPKTGTTSIDKAIGMAATIRLSGTKNNGLKHINTKKFNKWAKTLKKEFPDQKFVSCCVMREPIDWISSWFRYRSREGIKDRPNYTGNFTFEEYLSNLCDRSEHKKFPVFRGQSKFIIRKNKIAVDRIFPYAKMNNFIEYISEKLDKKIELPMKNISPELSESKMNLSNETLDRLKPLIALDVNIYNQILKMGSYDSSKNDHKSSLERIINNY